MIVTMKFEISNLLSTNSKSISEAETSSQFPFEYTSSRWLDCRGYGIFGFVIQRCEWRIKWWHDFVPSSLVLHDKTSLRKRYKRVVSEAETSSQFPLWNMLRHASWTVVDSNAIVTVFRGTLKVHQMLTSEEYKRGLSEAEASPQFLYGYASLRWLDCRGYKPFV